MKEGKKCEEGEEFKSYCFTCGKNICEKCKLNEHKGHKIKDFEKIKKEDKFQNLLSKILTKIKNIKIQIKKNSYEERFESEIIKAEPQNTENRKYDDSDFNKGENLANPNKDLELNFPYEYIKLIDIILNNMENGSPNYSHYSNIINIHIFLKIRKKNRLIIEYKNRKNGIIQILGPLFVKNNKDKCEIVFNQKFEELRENLDIKQDDQIFRMILVENKTVNNMANLFKGCVDLVSIYNNSKWDTSKVTNMINMLNGCSSLEIFPEINEWNTSNVEYLKGMFNGCTSLKEIKGLSKWLTNKVQNMSDLFKGCTGFVKIEGISEWNTGNVVQMDGIFDGCQKLDYLPDLSKWDTNKINTMKKMFQNCENLKTLPKISEWNVSRVIDFSEMFKGCKSLQNLPDLSEWKRIKGAIMENMFLGCETLESLHRIPNLFDEEDN